MRALRRQVLAHDVAKWAESFLGTLGADSDTELSPNRGVHLVDEPE